MKLYDYTLAPNPKRVRIFLAEKGVTVPMVQVDLRGGEQFTRIPGDQPGMHGAGAGIR